MEMIFMAEFCLKCFNRMNGYRLTEDDVRLSDELDLCEGCGRMKRVVETLRGRGLFGWARKLFHVKQK